MGMGEESGSKGRVRLKKKMSYIKKKDFDSEKDGID